MPTAHKLEKEIRMRMTSRVLIVIASFPFLANSQDFKGGGPASNVAAPPKAKIEIVVDDYYGKKIADPYRWLEDGKSAETQRFVDEENSYTQQILDSQPGKDKLRNRLEQLLTIGRVEAPKVGGDYYFYERREGNQNQPLVYVREGLQGEDRALIDVNTLASDGTVALDWWYPSPDGKYVAYGTSPNGSEISTLSLMESATGKLLPEQIERARFADVAWLPDHSGFYYGRFPRPGDVPAGQEMYNRHVFFHKLGYGENANGLKDALIFGEGLDPTYSPHPFVSNDGKWLMIEVDEGWAKSELLLRNLTDPSSKFVPVTTGKNFLYSGTILNNQLYITTNEDAPRYHVFKAPCADPERRNWKELIPQTDGVIEIDDPPAIIGQRLFVHYLRNASSALSIYDLSGKPVANASMPTLGSIFGRLGGKWDGKEGFFAFHSYVVPPTVYRVSLDGEVTAWARVKSDVDSSRYEIKQLWFNSKDGTRVPMFVVHRRNLALSGKNPTVLAGYGGFNLSRTPFFDRFAMLMLLEHGGIFADAQLRGGSEFGEEWHRAGMLERKQNVFDDFISAAEYLISQKYTDKEHLAITGASNGGLLVGAALTQRPDLFRAVVCQVPLLDMLRYQRFLIAKFWIPEYGSPDDPKQFEWLHAYSPYHHVKPGTLYPAILFMTADSDSRADPMHAKKMTALLQAQAANGPDHPILLRVDTKAGHGIGKPINKQIEDYVELWSFLFWQLGVSP